MKPFTFRLAALAKVRQAERDARRAELAAALVEHGRLAVLRQAVDDELDSQHQQHRAAILCAEALPWQCHRRLIADQFLAIGWQVLDIIGPHSTKPHELPPFAKITGSQVTYPGDPTLFN